MLHRDLWGGTGGREGVSVKIEGVWEGRAEGIRTLEDHILQARYTTVFT